MQLRPATDGHHSMAQLAGTVAKTRVNRSPNPNRSKMFYDRVRKSRRPPPSSVRALLYCSSVQLFGTPGTSDENASSRANLSLLPQPPPSLEVRVHRIAPALSVHGLCAGYEVGEWRCNQLAGHAMKWPREFALKHTEREPLRHANAVEFVARAARSICTPPNGIDRATQLRRRLGARIRALREARGLTQEMIAVRIEATQKYVSQVECGQRSPSWETLVAIAHQGFEIKLATLMFGIDEDLGVEVLDLSDVLAGRPKEARRDVLHAIELILRAGAGSK